MARQVNWEMGGQSKAEQLDILMQQVFCVHGQVVNEWGVEVIEGDVPICVQELAVKEVENGQYDDGTGESGVEDGWQGLEFFEDTFPKGVCKASIREDGVSRVDAEVGAKSDRTKPVDLG